MFIVNPDPTFKHDVKVRVPVDGGFVEQTFKTTFRVIPTEEMANFDLTDGGSSTEFFRRVIVTMEDLVGPDGKTAAPYSDALRDQLLSVAYVRSALGLTYFSAVAGN